MKHKIGEYDMNDRNRKLLINFLLVTLFSFALIFIGVMFVADKTVYAQNIFGYAVFSIVLGLISTGLYLMKPKIAYIIFNLGIIVGYIVMYVTFMSDMNGWEDLSGLLSLFIWILIGLGIGLIAQLGFYLYKKIKKAN